MRKEFKGFDEFVSTLFDIGLVGFVLFWLIGVFIMIAKVYQG